FIPARALSTERLFQEDVAYLEKHVERYRDAQRKGASVIAPNKSVSHPPEWRKNSLSGPPMPNPPPDPYTLDTTPKLLTGRMKKLIQTCCDPSRFTTVHALPRQMQRSINNTSRVVTEKPPQAPKVEGEGEAPPTPTPTPLVHLLWRVEVGVHGVKGMERWAGEVDEGETVRSVLGRVRKEHAVVDDCVYLRAEGLKGSPLMQLDLDATLKASLNRCHVVECPQLCVGRVSGPYLSLEEGREAWGPFVVPKVGKARNKGKR
ncbi:hypothetical protein KIPB_012901, partial [Kipferlia bialata]